MFAVGPCRRRVCGAVGSHGRQGWHAEPADVRGIEELVVACCMISVDARHRSFYGWDGLVVGGIVLEELYINEQQEQFSARVQSDKG